MSAVVFGGACGLRDEVFGERFIEHPIPDSVTASEGSVHLIRRSGREGVPERFREYRERLTNLLGTVTIGSLDGGAEYTFGLVSDATLTAEGEIVIADRQAGDVRFFDRAGNYLYAVGGAGEGPGEFRLPEAILVPAPGELWVVDQDQMLHRFRRDDADRAYRFVGRTRVGAYPYDACVLEKGLMLHAVDPLNPEVLYRVGADGALRAKFAVPYRYSAWLPREAMSRGQIACDGEDGVVVLAVRMRNAIEAYDVGSGRLLWHARAEGIRMPQVLEADGGARIGQSMIGVDTAHYLKRVAGGGAVPVLVQYERLEKAGEDSDVVVAGLETFAIDPVSGAGEYWGEGIPQVVRFDRRAIIVLYEEPFPRVEVAFLR